MKHKINLAEIEIKDLDGTIYEIADLAKTLGNAIFKAADTIELSEAAKVLHKGDTAEAAAEELQEIQSILQSFTYYKPWIKQQINEYFNNILTPKPNENRKKGSK